MIATCPRCGYSEPDCRSLMDHYLCGEPTPPAPTVRDLAESFVREAGAYDVRAAGHRMRWWAAEFGLAFSREAAAPASERKGEP